MSPSSQQPPSPPPAAQTDPWTTRRLLKWMTDTFTQKDLDSPRLMSEMLLSHVLGCQRLRLYTDQDRPASELERKALRDLVQRALKHEPVQYLVGEAWFFGLPFTVDRRVMIPRPATATIVDAVLLHARSQPGFGGSGGEGLLIADVCAGSGCVNVAILSRLTAARAIATDLCPDALAVASLNAVRHNTADRTEFLTGDLLAPLQGHPIAGKKDALHFLVSNPPYIPDDEWPAVEPNVKDHEPHKALRGGIDGLDFVRRLLDAGPDLIIPGGLLLIEVAASRAPQALALTQAHPALADARIMDDFEGLPRVISARRV